MPQMPQFSQTQSVGQFGDMGIFSLHVFREPLREKGYEHWAGAPLNDLHGLALVPQSVADCWQGFCSCGKWKATFSMWKANGRFAKDYIREAHEQHQQACADNGLAT